MESVMAVLNFDRLLELRSQIEARMKLLGVSKESLGDACPAFLKTPTFAGPGNKTEMPPASITELGYLAKRLDLILEITEINIISR